MRRIDSYVRVYGTTLGKSKLRLRQQISSANSWLAKLRKKLQREPEHRLSIERRMTIANSRLASLLLSLELEN